MNGEASAKLVQAIREYRMPLGAQGLLRQNPPLLIAGPTAVGKDTIAQRIVQESDYRRVVAHTTRPPRPDERDGDHYWFVNDDDILQLINTQAFIDIKIVHKTKVYGTTIAAYQKVLQSGAKPLWIIDIQGVTNIIRFMPSNARAVFVLPPDFNAWVERMEKQGPMSHVERLRRMESARSELQEVLNNPYYILVVNDELSRTVQEIIRGAAEPSIQHHNRELAQRLIEHITTH